MAWHIFDIHANFLTTVCTVAASISHRGCFTSSTKSKFVRFEIFKNLAGLRQEELILYLLLLYHKDEQIISKYS